MVPGDQSMGRNVKDTSKRRGWVGAAIIIAAALAAYGNSFSGPFVFDGQAAIQDNLSLRHLWPLGPALSPPPDGSPVSGRPITNLSFAINYALSGLHVWSYHLLNLVIHVLAGLVFFGILRRTFAGRSPGDPSQGDARATNIAIAAAVIWTVHPLQTESVTYLPQRAESLMGLFYLLTLYGFVRASEREGTPGKPRLCWFGLSWGACFLGMAAKEAMVTAPVMVLLYDQTFVSGGFRKAWGLRRGYYLGLAGTWLMLVYLMVRVGSRGSTVGFHTPVPWWGYALAQFKAIVHYLHLSLWPHPLVIDYGQKWTVPPLAVLVNGLIVVALVGATLFALRRRSPLGFLGAWFFLILAPTSSVVPIATEIVAEHRMYLPLAAVVVLIVVGLHAACGKKSLALFIALALGLGLITWRRNQDYRSARALWSETVESFPDNPGAHNNLGKALLEEKDFSAAEQEFEAAVRLDPNLPGGWNNVGATKLRLGQVQGAISAYENALRLVPEYAAARDGLGRAFVEAGQFPAAIRQLEETLRHQPDSVETLNFLAYALQKSGRKAEAMAEYREVLRLNPDHSQACYNLGNLLAQDGQLVEAIRVYEHALGLKPDWVEVQINLGTALVQVGRPSEAITHFVKVVKLKPDHAVAHYNLAIALQMAGRQEEAKAHFETAARLGINPP